MEIEELKEPSSDANTDSNHTIDLTEKSVYFAAQNTFREIKSREEEQEQQKPPETEYNNDSDDLENTTTKTDHLDTSPTVEDQQDNDKNTSRKEIKRNTKDSDSSFNDDNDIDMNNSWEWDKDKSLDRRIQLPPIPQTRQPMITFSVLQVQA